jgi:hypothetical protein
MFRRVVGGSSKVFVDTFGVESLCFIGRFLTSVVCVLDTVEVIYEMVYIGERKVALFLRV